MYHMDVIKINLFLFPNAVSTLNELFFLEDSFENHEKRSKGKIIICLSVQNECKNSTKKSKTFAIRAHNETATHNKTASTVT